MQTLTRLCCTTVAAFALLILLSTSRPAFAQTVYAFTPSNGASIVPGTTDVGNHCDDCVTAIALPFTYQLYDQSFTTAYVSSNGNLQFSSTNGYWNGCLPDGGISNAIVPQWTDLRTDGSSGAGVNGIFTSTSGSAPNRIFNIEWRTRYYNTNGGTANFEIRLYEAQPRFDIIYGTISQTNPAGIGVQKGTGSQATPYSCDNTPQSFGFQLAFELIQPPTGKIAFSSSRDRDPGGHSEIYVMNADGTNQTRLTNSTAIDAAPEWSPDGNKIAFASDRDNVFSGCPEIYVMNPDGSALTRLTNNPAFDESPIWSPDGSKIAFMSSRDDPDNNVRQIYVMNADGTNQTRLTFSNGYMWGPAWSPDGSKIAFAQDMRAFNPDIYVINADGSGGETRLTVAPEADTAPAWSPDGLKIAFISRRDGINNNEIYMMNADGTNQTRFTFSPAQEGGLDWSSDGSKIAFSASINFSSSDVYVMDADGTHMVRLTTHPEGDGHPSWQPQTNLNSGKLIISEFRFRGPGGANDEFVELYNNTGAPLTVSTTDGSAGWSLAASDGVARFTIPNGTVIPPHGHYLATNNTGYSLGAYPSGHDGTNPTTATGDDDSSPAPWTSGINDNAGIALFDTANPQNFTLPHRLDAAGSTSESNAFYKEGAGYPLITVPNDQWSLLRDSWTGAPQDTNANSADFVFISTGGYCANFATGPCTPRMQYLGAPGPENLTSPLNRTGTIPGFRIDSTAAASQSPNRVRDTNSYNDTLTPTTINGPYTLGTLSVRRRYTNATGTQVRRLRFRLVDVTSFPQPPGIADLRALTSPTITVNTNDAGVCSPSPAPCSVTVRGLTLEQPPTQGSGGGRNSTLSAGTIDLANPLPNGASIDVHFLLGVKQSGSFRFFVTVDALP
jgi:Tol biopolymer transport system component